MQKITTHLWFDKEAKAAAEFYAGVFPESKVASVRTLANTPSGEVEIVNMTLAGQEFTLLAAGPLFKFTPAVSFLLACATEAEVEAIWQKLAPGGTALMELGSYPFSSKYGWIQDKYGLSWQIMFMGERPAGARLTPTLMFTGAIAGRAEEALNFYTGIFPESKVEHIMRYEAGEAPDKEGTVRHAAFTLHGQMFAAMDSAHQHNFTFTEAISLMVHCADQAEIDYYWGKLSADPKAEQCGWLKDKYGLSWQVVPAVMNEMMAKGTPEQVARLTAAFLKMKKFDIATLEAAYHSS